MPPTRGTIVFLTSDYADYSKAAVESVSAVAHAAGFGTLCVTGRELAPESDVQSEQAVCNGIYHLIEQVDFAGLICESGLLGHLAGADAVIRFLRRFHLPCVSLGLDVPDIASVVVDDRIGMIRLMEHLIADTPSRRFAFVQGLDGDMFSIEREQIFREVLARHGREIDESLFVRGNYDVFDAYKVVERLLRSPGKVDAIVAANDTMALSAARAASAAGLSIPRDIVVTGFDDVPDATRISPALTTVRQPLVESAEIGIDRLLELIDVTPTGARPVVPAERRLSRLSSEFVMRGSTASATTPSSGSERIDADALHTLIVVGMSGLKVPEGTDMRAMSSAVEETLIHGSQALADHLTRVAARIDPGDAHWWSNLCHQIEELGQRLLQENDRTARLPLIEAALARVRERIWAAEMEREFAARRLERMRSNMQLQIGSSTGIDEILDAIDRWTFAFSPKRLFLVRYDEPAAEPRPRGQLIRAFRAGVIEPVTDEILVTSDILPVSLAAELEKGTLVMNPVYAGSDHFGYLLIDPEGLDLSQIDSAAHSIGNAMRSQYLIDALESQALRLRDVNVELSTLANQDALTGLPNRLCFERKLRKSCDRCIESGRFALCFLDLDGFKAVNDSLGHETGDALLKSVTARLERVVLDCVGDGGFVARLGGDEFTTIIESDTIEADLERLLPAVLDAVRASHLLSGQVVRISASIGGAIYPDHGRDPRTLLQRADAAMYEAKSGGKNDFVLFREGGNDAGSDVPSRSRGDDPAATSRPAGAEKLTGPDKMATRRAA